MVYLWMCFFDSAWILIFWTYRQWKAERSLPWWTTWIELGRLAFSTSPISRKEIPSLLAHFLLGLLEIQHILPELTSTVPSGLQVSICQVSSPESVLSPWLVSDAVLHLFAQIMRFTTSLMSRISTEARASLHSFALCLEKIKGIRVERGEQGRHVQGSQASSHLVWMMSKIG